MPRCAAGTRAIAFRRYTDIAGEVGVWWGETAGARLMDPLSMLIAYAAEAGARPFRPGRHDCALFAAGWVKQVPPARTSPAAGAARYRSLKRGQTLLETAGFADHVALAAAQLPEIAPAFAQVGDLAVLEDQRLRHCRRRDDLLPAPGRARACPPLGHAPRLCRENRLMPPVGAAIAAVGAAISGTVAAISAFAASSFIASMIVNTAISVGVSLIARALTPKPTIKQSGIQTCGDHHGRHRATGVYPRPHRHRRPPCLPADEP
jgi:hypothetical protein